MSKKKPSYQDLEKLIIKLKTENKLKQTEERFSMLLKASEDMITIHKPNGEYLYYNGPTCYAITANDVVGKMPNDLFDKNTSTELFDAFKRVSQTGNSETIEVLLDWLGEKRWFSEYIYPLKNDGGKVVEIVKVCRDIHKRKIAEQIIEQQNKEKEKQVKELELSRQKIQTTLELLEKKNYSMGEASKIAKIGYWEHDFITEKVIWSDYVHYIFGSNPKDGIPLQEEIYKNFSKESQDKIAEVTQKLISKGIPYDIELKWTNHKKEEIWIRNVAQPIFNNENEVVGKRGVMQNITESKKAQYDLELSKENMQTTLELVKENEYSLKEGGRMAKIGYWRFDFYSELLFWSDAIYQIYGSDPKLGVPKIEKILTVFNEESRKLLLEKVLILTNKGIPYDIELELTNFKNEKRWIRNIGEPIYNENNEIIGRRGVSQDITQRKSNEIDLDKKNEKLYELNNALNQAQKLSNVGSWQWNMAKDTAEWSDEMYNIYGVSKESFYPSNENVSKTVLPEDLYKVEQGVASLLENEIFVPFEFRMVRPSGEIRHLYIMALEKKSKDSVFGVTKDITDRKLIEEENLRIQDNYVRLFDNATVSIWNEDFSLVFDLIDELRKLNISNITLYLEQHPEILFKLLESLKVNKVNKATLKLFKAKSNEEFLNKITETFAEGADKVFGKLIESIWNKEETFTSEVNYKTLEGDNFAAIISIPIPQTRIEQKTVPVSIQSIQKIKQAEVENKEILNRLNEAQKLAKIGSWYFIPLSEEVVCSEEIFNLFGLDPDKGFPKIDEFMNIVHKDDQKLLMDSIANVKPYDIDYRINLPNGSEKWVRTIGEPILGDNGEVIRLKGNSQDITSQKRAREKIEKAEEMYRLLSDNSNDLICLQERDSRFKYISPSIKNLLGYEQSEFLGKKVFSIVHQEDVNKLKEAIDQKVFNAAFAKPFNLRVLHKKGHFVWFEFLSSPVYKDNEINYFVTSARDITQWELAKQEIQEYQTSLQKMTTEMSLIEEKQKKEIASNIHDHLSQSLVISKMKINELKKNPKLKFIGEDLMFIENHISEALENSRKITYELSPPVLYQLGIIDALNWLFENVEATHKIECKINSNVSNIKLSDVKSILVYRCIQELIKNVIKYANATLLTLNLDKNELGINILLTDNGDGFNTSVLSNYQNHSGSGFGLFAVQERIKNIKGEFTITSKINAGTSINIFIPLT